MATKNFVPRATGEGQIGTTTKKWDKHIAISGAYSYVSSSGTGSFNHLLVAGNSVLSGDLTLGGDITIGDAASDNLVISADLSSSLIPNASDAYNLGSATQRWNNLFLSGSISASGGPHSFFGNVGVGTSVPSQLLTVAGNISGSKTLWVGNQSSYISASNGSIRVTGNISGSATSTGSFGEIRASSKTLTINNVGTVSGSVYSTGSFGEIRASSKTLTINNVGTVSGSSSSTGSFGRIDASARIFESGTSVIDHATAMAIVFGG